MSAIVPGWTNFWDRPEPTPPPIQAWERFLTQVRAAHRQGAFNDEEVRDAFAHWGRQPDDEYRASLARQQVIHWQIRNFNFPFETPDPSVIGTGEILLGTTVPDGLPVRITREQACSHLAFLGGTGAGKSVFCYNLVLNSRDAFAARWVFDFYSKDRWRGLRRSIKDFVICPWSRAKLNLLNPSDRFPTSEIAGDVVDDLSQAFDVRPHSRQYLRSALRASDHGSVRQLLGHLERADYRFQDALVEKLEALANQFPQYARGWPMRTLLGTSVLWELQGLDADLQTFFLSRLVRAAFREKTRFPAGDGLLIVVDEGNRVFASGSSLAEVTSIVRAAGFALVICFQSVRGDRAISPAVVDNAAVKLLGRTGSAESLETFGRGMGLNADQLRWARRNLRPGMLVATHPDWPEPFILTYPNLCPPRVSEEEAEESLKPLLALPTVAAEETPVASGAGEQPRFTANERVFLEVLCERPFENASALYKHLPWSAKTSVNIKDKLVAVGLVRPYEDRVAWSRRGRPKLFLEPTPEAFAALGREKRSWGRGGYAHALYAHLIGARLERDGFAVEYESALSTGQFLDVLARSRERAIGVEVELSERHAVENMRKALHHSIAELWVAAPSDVLDRIRATVLEAAANVSFLLLSDAVNGRLPTGAASYEVSLLPPARQGAKDGTV